MAGRYRLLVDHRRRSGLPTLSLTITTPLLLLTVVLFSLAVKVEENHNDRVNQLPKHPVMIVVSFDGFRYNYFQRADTPNLDALKDSGVSVQYMRNQFVTKTFPNHMSIATGLHAESHGVVDNLLYDPKYQRVLDYRNPEFWNFDNTTIPLWTLNELRGDGRKSGVIMWPGSPFPYGAKGTFPSRSLPWNESYPFEQRVDLAVDWITDEKDPVNLVFLYFEEPDEIAHGYGPESAEVTKYIQVVDNITGYLVSKLKSVGVYEKVNLIILSDHGFQEVKQQNIIKYKTALVPKSFQSFGSSPVIHILPNDGMTEEVYFSLESLSHGKNFTVYKKEDMEPVWFYRNNRRIMPIVLVADLGYVFEDFEENIKMYNEKFNFTPSPDRVYGTHGYDNRKLPMHPFFMAHGPAFRKGYEGVVFDNIDLYPLICKIIGISPESHNGSLSNVAQLLKRKGFAMGSPVGWAMGLAVLIGVFLILGILYAIVSNKRNRRRECIPEVPKASEFFEIGNGNGKSKVFPVPLEECQALLLSSSNEEL